MKTARNNRGVIGQLGDRVGDRGSRAPDSMDHSAAVPPNPLFAEQDELNPGDPILRLIDPEHREAFIAFVNAGQFDAAFAAYLDSTPDAQRAVDLILTEQARSFSAYSAAIKASTRVDDVRDQEIARATRRSGGVSSMLRDVIRRVFGGRSS